VPRTPSPAEIYNAKETAENRKETELGQDELFFGDISRI
jgi:hypothetical protein